MFGSLEGQHLAYIGDGNNVAASLAIACAMLGVAFTIASPEPEEFRLDPRFLPSLADRFENTNLRQVTDPRDAVAEASVVYTDVWASMGQEAEAERRKAAFANYRVDEQLLAIAPPGVRFMHDLPAKRGLEVTDGVMDGSASIVFRQAENRMHLAKGLLLWLIAKNDSAVSLPEID